MIRWPAALGPESFLRDHWQKAALLLPGGLPHLENLPTPEELAGLACEAEVESRLVTGSTESGWAVRHGPFADEDFLDLPDTGWTLLVQDVDKHLPALSHLLDAFDFIPRWRLDDLMISFAAPGGSVGPHLDAYDVFLIQATGTREWGLDPQPEDVSCRDDCDLKVLREFRPVKRHHLGPGDVLYLPPGVAHFGMSNDPAMTCSIGFRSPSAAELLAAASLLAEEQFPLMYRDTDLSPPEADGSRISAAAVERLRSLMVSTTTAVEGRMAELLGRLATQGKPWLLPDPLEEAPSTDEVLLRLQSGETLERHPGSRFAWDETDAACRLFADGCVWSLPLSASEACRDLADGALRDPRSLTRHGLPLAEVVRDLLSKGCLAWSDRGRDRQP